MGCARDEGPRRPGRRPAHQQAQGQALFVQASEGAAVWILVEALEQGGDGAATGQLGKARAVALQPRQRPQGAIAGFQFLFQIAGGDPQPAQAHAAARRQDIEGLHRLAGAEHRRTAQVVEIRLAAVDAVPPLAIEHLHDAQAFRQHLVGSQRLGEAQVAIEILHRRAHRPRLVVTGGAAEHFARVEDLRLAQG